LFVPSDMVKIVWSIWGWVMKSVAWHAG